jgi:hypothetical protein
MKNNAPKFKNGDAVKVSTNSNSPYKGCEGVVEVIMKEENGILYFVQFGKPGDSAFLNHFKEEELQAAANQRNSTTSFLQHGY